ncbi:MAG: hypothetical protein ACUVX1_10115 [Chloroflexota bacterium]
MTHTLHRKGSVDDLREDFVVFSMAAKTVNRQGADEKMRKFFEIVEKYNPVNYGDMKTGNGFDVARDVIYDQIRDTSIVHFVFTDKATVGQVLKDLAKAELGPSVVVSGCIDDIDELCKAAGINPMHTVEYSGGIHGKLDLLHDEPVLEITTMCGHGLVAGNLVKEMVRQVKSGKKTLQEAGVELARPCQCGVFNPKRAEKLLEKLL